jgi:hypothetical protein
MPGQEMMSPASPRLAAASPASLSRPQGRHVVELHMRQHQVLVVGDADLGEAVALGEIGDDAHLLRRGVARNAALGLQRDVDDGVAGLAVGG